ncbi:MAG: hypothetical protein AAGL24_28820 [Pseudomonadota bacterium]
MERFFFGVFGSILPDCVVFYSKRFTAPLLEFDLVQYLIVMGIYGMAAGIVAWIYPYKGGYSRWKAVIIGVTMPFIVSGLIAVADRTGGADGIDVNVRGPQVTAGTTPDDPDAALIPGTIIDLVTMF